MAERAGAGGAARAVGVIAIADQPRPEAAQALAALHALGVKRVAMFTGDNRGTADAVAGRLGVDEVRAGLLADDKVRVVRALEASGEHVAFVGARTAPANAVGRPAMATVRRSHEAQRAVL